MPLGSQGHELKAADGAFLLASHSFDFGIVEGLGMLRGCLGFRVSDSGFAQTHTLTGGRGKQLVILTCCTFTPDCIGQDLESSSAFPSCKRAMFCMLVATPLGCASGST